VKAAEIEGRIVDLIKDQPMKTGEIAKLTASGKSSTSGQLRRLRERGLVQVGGDGGWTATEARMTP
jgi:Mn-dependent DtxR family transcriptional regulator